MHEEVVAGIDLEAVARTDESRHGALLDQQRPIEDTARRQVRTGIDRHVAPAMRRIEPDLARLARLGRIGAAGPRGRRRPVEWIAADDAQRRAVDAATRLALA